MERFVYEDTPLASYLEGTGEAPTPDEIQDEVGDGAESLGRLADHEAVPSVESSSPSSFAPAGSSTAYAAYRKRIPKALRLHVKSTSRSLSRLRFLFSSTIKGCPSPQVNATFLERFRYIIVASDLLSEHHHGCHGHLGAGGPTQSTSLSTDEIVKPVFSTMGVFGVTGSAFVLAGSIAWVRELIRGSGLVQAAVVLAYLLIGAVSCFAFGRRKNLQHLRDQTLKGATAFVSNAHAFDAAFSATVTIVQEVELVARGYRISNPLPPVSRFDDQGQHRRCARLRSAACRASHNVLQPLANAAILLESEAVRADSERYQDIYEITRMDVDEVEQLSVSGGAEQEDGESLKALKISMHRLFMVRRLLLCNLLALDADGSHADVPRWSLVLQTMQSLSSNYQASAVALDGLLSDDERFALPTTPRLPFTPGHERARTQIRKLGGLSSGIRALQARMQMLREEADRSLDSSEDSNELNQNLLSQYDAVGSDLRALLREWEDGRAALTSSRDKRRSMSSAGFLSPRAETPTSLSGSTATGGSPAEAFRVLTGEPLSPNLDITSSDEEVFEAVAMPRQRSSLTREGRITKMREDRRQREQARESRQASTNMLRELETVLKHKPQASKTARRVTVM